MTGNEYQKLAMRTNDGGCHERAAGFIESEGCNPNLQDIKNGDLINGVMGLAGEAGECIDYVKKAIFHKHDFNATELAKELGDIMWYVAMCCNAIGISLDDVMQGNIEKLKRRYPNGFNEHDSQNRIE